MIAISGIAATALLLTLQPALALNVPGASINNIFARQGGFTPGAIPQTCATSCQTVQSVTSTCSQLSCLCTPAVDQGMKSCLQCAVSAGAAGYTQASADSTLNEFESACTGANFPLSGGSTSGGTTGSSGGSDGSGGGLSGLSPTATALSPGTTALSATGLGATVPGSGATGLGAGGSTVTVTAAAPAATTGAGGLPKINAASTFNVGTLGVMVTVAFGTIALL